MQNAASENFTVLVDLIKEVKPSLADKSVALEDSVTDHLGLDSLDMLQLSRMIRRKLGRNFDLDTWSEGKNTHDRTVGSILDEVARV